MILDNFLTLSGAWASGVWTPQLITSVGTTNSTNVYDTTGNTRQLQAIDLGQGEVLKIEISVVNTLTSSGAATIAFNLVQADDAGLSVNVNIIVQEPPTAYTVLTAGTIVPMTFDRVAPNIARRYIGLQYIVATAALTNGTGQFITNIVKDIQDKGANTIFQSGFVVQ